MLVKDMEKLNPNTLTVALEINIANVENNIEFLKNLKIDTT